MQHNLDIQSQPCSIFRADIQNALQSANSGQSGIIAPSDVIANMSYFDTTLGIQKRRDEGNENWLDEYKTGRNLLHANLNKTAGDYHLTASQLTALQQFSVGGGGGGGSAEQIVGEINLTADTASITFNNLVPDDEPGGYRLLCSWYGNVWMAVTPGNHGINEFLTSWVAADYMGNWSAPAALWGYHMPMTNLQNAQQFCIVDITGMWTNDMGAMNPLGGWSSNPASAMYYTALASGHFDQDGYPKQFWATSIHGVIPRTDMTSLTISAIYGNNAFLAGSKFLLLRKR